MAVLLDVNFLIALSAPEHPHSASASKWFGANSENFALCPITEGGLLRFLIRGGYSAENALIGLARIKSISGYEFWTDDISYDSISFAGVVGHRQVTDAYLAGLARSKGGKIATFDTGLASSHSDVAVLVPKALRGFALCGQLEQGGADVPTWLIASATF